MSTSSSPTHSPDSLAYSREGYRVTAHLLAPSGTWDVHVLVHDEIQNALVQLNALVPEDPRGLIFHKQFHWSPPPEYVPADPIPLPTPRLIGVTYSVCSPHGGLAYASYTSWAPTPEPPHDLEAHAAAQEKRANVADAALAEAKRALIAVTASKSWEDARYEANTGLNHVAKILSDESES